MFFLLLFLLHIKSEDLKLLFILVLYLCIFKKSILRKFCIIAYSQKSSARYSVIFHDNYDNLNLII